MGVELIIFPVFFSSILKNLISHSIWHIRLPTKAYTAEPQMSANNQAD
uniref:Uncharacterized protein n=1 Tax=Rhizophora mucronata TaxID=61149 RepID=A0A2P2R1N2_RHIMU